MKKVSFQSKLERIAKGMEYFALSVPLKVTRALGTKGPVPVRAQVNGSESFVASFYPVGGGRHYLRVRNKICKAAGIKPGDRVRVQATVRDRSAEVSAPSDLRAALRAEGVSAAFESMPPGKKAFLLRLIDQAAKAQTRARRIQDAVEEAHRRREKAADRR